MTNIEEWVTIIGLDESWVTSDDERRYYKQFIGKAVRVASRGVYYFELYLPPPDGIGIQTSWHESEFRPSTEGEIRKSILYEGVKKI